MAIIKPTSPTAPPNGRGAGTLFYRAGGRTLARNIVQPITSRTDLQQRRRSVLGGSAQRWAYVLTTNQQAVWDSFSKFGGDGELEIANASMSADIAGEPLPVNRATSLPPGPPIVIAVTYTQSPFTLTALVAGPGPTGQFARNWSATGPTPSSRKPRNRDLRVFRTGPATPGTTDLAPAYIAKFGTPGPTTRQIRLQITHFEKATPATGPETIITVAPSNEPTAGLTILAGNPITKLGVAQVQIQPRFAGSPFGSPVSLFVNAPDMTNTFPATINNFQTTFGSLTDVLGLNGTRTATFTMTDINSLAIALTVSPRISF